MKRTLIGVVALLTQPSGADEIADALSTALDAYRAGDVAAATEEVEYARQLLAQMKVHSLEGFLPEPLEGWTRTDGESGSLAGLGGMIAQAEYSGPEGKVDIEIMADNQMVASMAMMFSNPMMMGQMGELKRIGRQKVILSREGELQTILDNNVLVQISGSAPPEVKEAYFNAMDLQGLQDF